MFKNYKSGNRPDFKKKDDRFDLSSIKIPFMTIKSRKQFATLWKSQARDTLVQMFEWFFRHIDIRDVVEAIESNLDKDDEAIYRSLHKLSVDNPKPEQPLRASSRVKDLSKLLSPAVTKNIKSYLDLGCGDGSITNEVAKWLDIPKSKAFGADLEVWYSGTQAFKEQSNVTFTPVTGDGKLPFDDKKFDLVTCFVSLHHFAALQTYLEELNRVVAPGGILLIREHDCNSNSTNMLIDIYHMLFELVLASEPDYSILDTHYGVYRDKHAWSNLLSKYGFKYNSKIRYMPVYNELRLYYAVYQKS